MDRYVTAGAARSNSLAGLTFTHRTFVAMGILALLDRTPQRPYNEDWRNPSRSPSESAGFDLFDLIDALRRGVEPDTDVAVTLSKLRGQVLNGNPGLPG